MQRIVATVVIVGALTLSGCTTPDTEDEPTAPMTEIAIECDEYAATAQRITEAQTAMYTGDDAALEDLLGELDALAEEAPAEVQAAITSLGEGFISAQELMADPTADNQAAMTELAPRLAEDSQLITDYIVGECGG